MKKRINRLQSLLNSEQEICADTSALNTARKVAISDLSEVCKNTITAGFSVILSDGKRNSFRLTAEDQINLLNLEGQLRAGENLFVYHATNMPCRVFTREDTRKILKAYRKHILYHTTYFNAAKQYINSLTSLDSIKTFTYGTDITDTVTDPVLHQILLSGSESR